ncbi:hypothetical protein EP554_02785 [Salmonella enterica]|nr:hypothetical protein [Salmonella enterica]EBG4969167.1 hypothetical protein [Salmonella enterica subsp. enterica serovar Agoueve]EBV5821947.1 hypothetical protein [Salmonella enterica subsp. enterica serovar Cubana]EDT8874632.1 hypothetical protein [Salmonella enterica subsp. enterica]EAP7984120.1 hypothetical protein [Salmonella enterica]
MITITKLKRFFMGALVGTLLEQNTNKTNNKQHVNRGYDSESATYSENPAYGWVFAFLGMEIRSPHLRPD